MKDCNQCGKCCLAYGGGSLSATVQEIDGWELFNPAIAEYVADGKIWMDPVTGKQLTRCPWLELMPDSSGSSQPKYGCSIYHDRPQDCRHYPVLIADMIRDGCEMLEDGDMGSPDEAQLALDKLMTDSRPPLT